MIELRTNRGLEPVVAPTTPADRSAGRPPGTALRVARSEDGRVRRESAGHRDDEGLVMGGDEKPVSGYHIAVSERQALSVTWLLRFVRDAGYPISQTGVVIVDNAYLIGSPTAFHIDVTMIEEKPWMVATASDHAEQAAIDEMVQRSGERVADLLERWQVGGSTDEDWGGREWYRTTLTTESLHAEFGGATVFDRTIEMFNRPRLLGWMKFGLVIVNFREDQSEPEPTEDAIIARTPVVDLYVPAFGPTDGPSTFAQAHRLIEIAAALCTFALRRPLNLSPFVNSVRDEELLVDLNTKLDSPQPTYVRLGVQLELAFIAAQAGDLDSYTRICAALRTFDSAIRQERAEVAVILYVAAAECLANPYQSWKKDKVTKRFKAFYNELMPDDLDILVQHGNFEEAFGIRRGTRKPESLRKSLLDELYGARSEPVHEGLSASFSPMGTLSVGALRRQIASYFAELAILRYMWSPRTSLIGHPNVELALTTAETPDSAPDDGPVESSGPADGIDVDAVRKRTRHSRQDLAKYGITISSDHFERPMIASVDSTGSGARTLS